MNKHYVDNTQVRIVCVHRKKYKAMVQFHNRNKVLLDHQMSKNNLQLDIFYCVHMRSAKNLCTQLLLLHTQYKQR
jgi:hypothetical protein